MIIEIRAKNCFVVDEEIAFSMKADMRNQTFASNVYRENNFNILKTVGIYGPNNAGKTCLVRCIRAIKQVLLNNKMDLLPNMFTADRVCELGVTFLSSGRKFSYDFRYDAEKEEFLYERFSEILKDTYGNEKEDTWLIKDVIKKQYDCADEDAQKMMPLVAKNNLLCYLIDTGRFEHLEKMKTVIVDFAKRIDIINMNNIPLQHTIKIMKNHNHLQKKIVEFIKNADVYMDNFEYVEMDKIRLPGNNKNERAEERVLNLPDEVMDQMRLISTYKGVPFPSI